MTTSDDSARSSKYLLTVAIAKGETAASWARKNNVPRRTAQRWASEAGTRAAVEKMRRQVLDRAVGVMSTRAKWAADRIVKLGDNADSESVRLTALRALFSDMVAVSKFGGLEDRLSEVEEYIRDDSRSAGCAG